MRELSAGHYLRLKALTRKLIKLCGGVASAAELTRVGKSQLSDYGNAAKPESFAPIDVVADLEAAVGQQVVTGEMAESCGGAEETPAADADLLALGAKVQVEVGEFSAAALDAMSDGKICTAEMATLRKEAEDILIKARELHNALHGLSAQALIRPVTH